MGQLSNAGFDASSAATATRNILLNLADANSDLAKRLKEPVKDLPSLVRGLEQLKSEGIDVGEALQLTDKRSVAAFSTFLEGTDSVLKLNEELQNAAGTAQEMADKQLDNLSGAVTILNSAWEGFILSVEDGNGSLGRFLKNAVRVITEILSIASGTEKAASELDAYGRKVRSVANNIIRFGKVVGALVAGFVAYKTTVLASRLATALWSTATKAAAFTTNLFKNGLKGATTAFKGLNTAMKANPIGLVVSAITTLITALTLFKDSADDAADAQDNLNKKLEESEKLGRLQDIQKRYDARRKLNKQQLQTLKSDLEDRLTAEEQANAKVIAANEIYIKNIERQIERRRKLIKEDEDRIKTRSELGLASPDSIQAIKEYKTEIANLEKELEKYNNTNDDVLKTQEQIIEVQKLLNALRKSGSKTTVGLLEEIAAKEKALREEQSKTRDKERIREINKELEEQKKLRNDLLGISEKEAAAGLSSALEDAANKEKKRREEEKKATIQLQKEIDKLEFDKRLADIEDEKKKEEAILENKIALEKKAVEESKAIQSKKTEAIKLLEEQEARELAAIDEKYKKKKREETIQFVQEESAVAVNGALNTLETINQADQDKIERDIQATQEKISKQQQLAANGLANTLAFEEAQLAKQEQKKLKAEKRAIQLEKIKALYSAYSSAASSGDANAIATVLKDFAIIQGLEVALTSFGEGTAEYGTIMDALEVKNGAKGGNSINNGFVRGESHAKRGKGIPVLVEGNEGILDGNRMNKIGGASGWMELTKAIDAGVIGSDIFGGQVGQVPVINSINVDLGHLGSKLDSVEKAIKNKPVQEINVESLSKSFTDIVETKSTGNKRVISRYRINKTRI